MIQHLKFERRKWDYNKNRPKTKFHTDCLLTTHPIKSRTNPNGKAEGISFKWTLIITAELIECLYYSAEDWYIFTDRNFTDNELWVIIRQSYNRANDDLAPSNIKVGFNAGFPLFDSIPLNLSEIRQVLDM